MSYSAALRSCTIVLQNAAVEGPELKSALMAEGNFLGEWLDEAGSLGLEDTMAASFSHTDELSAFSCMSQNSWAERLCRVTWPGICPAFN